jgi:CheY-like chemotaxis protein
VVLDITLPGLSGLDVLREIRRIDPLARVILTSAYDRGSAGNAVAGDQAGVSFIRKPYRVDDLVHLLGQAMPAAQSNILGSTQRV